MKWYEGGFKPEIDPSWPIKELWGGGMIMVGSKNSLKVQFKVALLL